jgi:hypothetical protein
MQADRIEDCVSLATKEFKDVQHVQQTWFRLLETLVNLLIVRHLVRFNVDIRGDAAKQRIVKL